MDENWLLSLQQNTALIVPTRSLANTLNEQIAKHHIAQGLRVWEAPTILIWRDYLKELWQLNRRTFNSQHLISAQQSQLMWHQVIEASRREDQALMLLNVQQTARAVQKSWVLMHDWQLSDEGLKQDHVADTQQFLSWLGDYQELLSKKALLDEPLLVSGLCNSDSELKFPHEKVIFYGFDLINNAQKIINHKAQAQGVFIEHKAVAYKHGETKYKVYEDSTVEIKAALQSARKLIEEDDSRLINIVIHDLQDRQSQVEELAREIFYPSKSPLHAQQSSTVYRFSLGQRLNEWAAIETALSVIGLLKNRTTSSDLSFILRNQFLGFSAKYRNECRVFDRWLKRRRIRNIMLDKLPGLYQQCLDAQPNDVNESELEGLMQGLNVLVDKRQQLIEKIALAKEKNNFAAITFADWVSVFNDWLGDWGWSTKTVGNDLNTVQHQLLNRWQSLMEEFAGLVAVQRQIGMTKSLDLLQRMARDAMFIPKAVASPILISSILEAIGRPADYCFVIGMNENFPPAPKSDAFISQRLLANAGHPDMDANTSYQQANTVMQNLLDSVGDTVISYAKQGDKDTGIASQASPLFQKHVFDSKELEQTKPLIDSSHIVESFEDTQGPSWPDASKAQGGSKIFENQSNCPFKAFVTHQLQFQKEEDAEFGLDHLDRGNVIHLLLDFVWAKLKKQSTLKQKSEQEIEALISQVIDELLINKELDFQTDKIALLNYEKPRLVALLKEWLIIESRRPEPFTVIEREKQRLGEIAGIRFKYIIDRVDNTDDGRTVVIDYKTGNVKSSDWVSDPIKSTQMPLYSVALSTLRQQPVSGIAYGSVRKGESKFIELSEQGVFRKANSKTAKDEALWKEKSTQWPQVFDKLATDFLAGNAEVNPVDEHTCNYCDLNSVCRISQLKEQQVTQAQVSSND